jgi:sugar/nucleoside kinase (ribokinase family)
LLRKAKAAGLTVSIGVGGDPRGRWDLQDLYPKVDLLFVGEPAAKALGGSARALGNRVTLVVVQRAGKGGVALTKGREWKAPGLAEGAVFDAAFLDGWLDGHRVGEILAYAVAASSLAAEAGADIGATPTRAEALHHVGREKN